MLFVLHNCACNIYYLITGGRCLSARIGYIPPVEQIKFFFKLKRKIVLSGFEDDVKGGLRVDVGTSFSKS